ncbi:MAG: Phosphoribosylglycinamide formyltransferase [Verrucomicrobiales bacterium]|nr:Phosphoribosylglycinamide formyltransferase [Verrucomicrobiales bacterium]
MPVLTAAEAAAWRQNLAASGRRVVFTSGCFDILHAGHVRYLAQAKGLGDALLVALNSDSSVRQIKGPARPVNSEDDRAEVLLGLESVDAIVIFDEPRTTGLIETIQPQIFAKGGDYTLDSLNPEELAALRSIGAEIHILPELKGRSTTATLARMALPENPTTPSASSSSPQSNPSRLPRLGVLGSGEGSNFGVLLDAIDAGTLKAEVALVLSDNPGAKILDRAHARGIPAEWINPGDHPNRFSAEAQQAVSGQFRAAGCDLIVCAGFMRRLKDPVLSDFAGRIVNIHPSLLPAFPGRSAWAQAFEAKVPETGCTVHLIDVGIDTGPILAQTKVPILPEDTVDDVRRRIQSAEHALFPQAIGDLLKTLGPFRALA